jgi:hypothetical protein
MAQHDTQQSAICVGGISFSESAVTEVESGKVMVSIARTDVRRISLRHASRAQRPLVQIVMGAVLVGVGLIPLRHLIDWMSRGGVIFEFELLLFGLPVVGVWLIFESLSRGYFLDVEQSSGSKKMLFHGKISPEQIEEFLKAAEDRMGYRIDRITPMG